MDQVGPSLIVHPQHCGAQTTEGSIGLEALFIRRASVGDASVLADDVLAPFLFLLLNVEGLRKGTEVDGAVVATDFTADAARAQLVRDGRVRVDGEGDGATLAASGQCPARMRSSSSDSLCSGAGGCLKRSVVKCPR